MKKLLLLFTGLLFSIVLYSQSVLTPFQDWTTTAGSQNFFEKNVTKTDAAKNVYIAGATLNSSGNYDMLLQKINSAGSVLWTKQYDGLAHSQDMATNLFIDASSNVYIVGEVVNDTVTGFSDIITIKYNSSGVQQWVATYNGSGSAYDAGSCITLDGSGNVFVGGSGFNSSGNTDYIAVKYNSSGVQQWASQYNGSAGLNDAAIAINIASGQVIVTGLTQSTTTSYKPLTLVLNIGTGATIGTSLGSTGSSSMDVLNAVVKDASGNLYFAGGTPISGHGYDFTTIKVTSAGVLAWEVDYNGASGLDDIANGVQVDATGNVYTTGYTTTSTGQKNIMTVKYNSSGTQQWIETYNDSLNGNDEGKAIVLNGTNIYVTGYDSTAINGTDYYTLKYNSSGTEQWHVRADGDAHSEDKATNLAIDTSGNLIVSGESKKLNGSYEYKTIRYIEKNIITPTDYSSADTASNSFLYYQNKGQLLNTSDSLVPNIKYYTNYSNPDLYFTNNNYSMVFGHVDADESTMDTVQRIDVTFDQVNANAKIYSLEEKPEYLNYFLGHCGQGITEIHGNQRLVTTDLYPNIDLIYYSCQTGFKYYFIIKPGGDPTKIKMTYTGASSCSLNGTTNVLTINSNFGDMEFKRPRVYQLNTSNVVVPITGWTGDWVTNGTSTKYKLNVGTYNTAQTLVYMVDEEAVSCTPLPPISNLLWSSYYGSNHHDNIFATAISTGAAYTYNAGFTSGSDFPTSTGISNLLGDNTATLIQFDNAGGRVYSTLYGGKSFDEAYGVSINSTTGEATIVGQTYSTGAAPVGLLINHPGNSYYQSGTNGGGMDGFIARFNYTGTVLKYSTYFGSTGDEALNKIVLAGNDKYVVGKGDNNTPHVTRSGAYNSPTTPSGNKGIIAHFNSSDSLIWSTYIGSEIKDVDYRAVVGGVLFCGQVTTTNLPWKHAVGEYIDTTLSGSSDAFFARVSPSKDTITYCTYYGSSSDDICNAVKFDNTGNYYGTGETGKDMDGVSTNNLSLYNPGGTAYFDSVYNGNGDVVIWKFSDKNTRMLTTYYGMNTGSGYEAAYEDFGNDVTIDNYNQPYFCGTTRSPLDIITFSPPSGQWYLALFYPPYNTIGQAFILGLTADVQPKWATSFNGQGDQTGESIAYDPSHNYLYLTGGTTTASTSFGFEAVKPSSTFTGWYECENASGGGMFDGYIAQFKLTDNALGIDELSDKTKNDLISFPNPFSNEITFNFNTNGSQDYTIDIYNTLGQLIFSKKEKTNETAISKTVTLPEMDKGMYFVQINLHSRILAGKIIKQ